MITSLQEKIDFKSITSTLKTLHPHNVHLTLRIEKSICGAELTSQEGTTQGDPLAMPWYSMNTTTLINFLRNREHVVKQVWLADDAAAGGRLEGLLTGMKR